MIRGEPDDLLKLEQIGSATNWDRHGVSLLMHFVLDWYFKHKGIEHRCRLCRIKHTYRYHGIYQTSRSKACSGTNTIESIARGDGELFPCTLWSCQNCGDTLSIRVGCIPLLVRFLLYLEDKDA